MREKKSLNKDKHVKPILSRQRCEEDWKALNEARARGLGCRYKGQENLRMF